MSETMIQPLDYSQKASWYQIPEVTKDIDTFYIFATNYIASSMEEGAPDFAPLDNPEFLQGTAGEYMLHASAYEEATNVFVPYYRQAGLRYAGVVWKATGTIDDAISGMPYTDIKAALDYYFENCNGGRPFIIAGHSQGSAIVKYALKNYFKEHPEYYKRMVAAYVIGYAVTKDDLKAYPYLKFATGESDTGVIISYNTEGRKNVEENVSTAVLLPGAISINPLNWKLDDTYAPACENLGSLAMNEKTGEYEHADVGADAQVIPERGTIVTNAKGEEMPEDLAKIASAFFGPDGRHGEDYILYYSNIKANVAKRIAAYRTKDEEKKIQPTDYSQKTSWYKFPKITKDIDTFYIYSTIFMGLNDGDPDYATLDNTEVLNGIKVEHAIKSSVFEESTNLFIPFYHQAGMKLAGETWLRIGSIDEAISGIPYTDIKAALDYYFENCNGDRPFIIAGHSQGAAILRLVLKKYFKVHPEYYKRMVAAYAIGYSITKEDLEAYPHMKFATGATDTGVIISWHVEGPKNMEANAQTAALLPNGVSINPLNWKRDETYAPASENLGSLVMDDKTGETEIRDINADAQVCIARGTVVTHANAVANEMAEFAGPQSYHQDDYSIFYNNIKENVAKRIESWKAK